MKKTVVSEYELEPESKRIETVMKSLWIDLNAHIVKLRSVMKSRARCLLRFHQSREEEEVRRKLRVEK
jgi:hypothetical protein